MKRFAIPAALAVVVVVGTIALGLGRQGDLSATTLDTGYLNPSTNAPDSGGAGDGFEYSPRVCLQRRVRRSRERDRLRRHPPLRRLQRQRAGGRNYHGHRSAGGLVAGGGVVGQRAIGVPVMGRRHQLKLQDRLGHG